MADRAHNLQRDQAIGQKLQRPVAIIFRRLTLSHRDQLGFSHAVELVRRRRLGAFLAVECLLETVDDEAFEEALDHLYTTAESLLGDFSINPPGPVTSALSKI